MRVNGCGRQAIVAARGSFKRRFERTTPCPISRNGSAGRRRRSRLFPVQGAAFPRGEQVMGDCRAAPRGRQRQRPPDAPCRRSRAAIWRSHVAGHARGRAGATAGERSDLASAAGSFRAAALAKVAAALDGRSAGRLRTPTVLAARTFRGLIEADLVERGCTAQDDHSP